jgi:PadR family transcriptional regulator, regulatory protein PadR
MTDRSGRYSAPSRPTHVYIKQAKQLFVSAPVAFQKEMCQASVGYLKVQIMNEKTDVKQGTLALMVLKTLDVLGSLHGYGIARRVEQISGDLLSVNQGTLYPLLLKLEQEGSIESDWGASENNRRARYYSLTKVGRRQLQSEVQEWQQTTEIMERFLSAKAEELG